MHNIITIYALPNECEIKSSTFYHEEQSDNSASALAIHFSNHNIQHQSICSRIIVVKSIDNINYTFISPLISKDKVSISMQLEMSNGLYIYADKNELSNYSFDLKYL